MDTIPHATAIINHAEGLALELQGN